MKMGEDKKDGDYLKNLSLVSVFVCLSSEKQVDVELGLLQQFSAKWRGCILICAEINAFNEKTPRQILFTKRSESLSICHTSYWLHKLRDENLEIAVCHLCVFTVGSPFFMKGLFMRQETVVRLKRPKKKSLWISVLSREFAPMVEMLCFHAKSFSRWCFK